MFSEWLWITTEYIALVSTAMSGAIVAIERRLDLIGVWFLSLIASFGGGVIRDLLLGETPPRFFTHYHWLLLVTLVSLGVFVIARCWRGWWKPQIRTVINHIHNLFDAVGLAAFTISGVQLAVAAGHMGNPFLCAFMGVITGVGGGILRDVMVMQTPGIFRKRIYAVASIFGAVLYWFCLRYSVLEELAWMFTMLTIVAIRVCATVFRWNLPCVPVPGDQPEAKKQIKKKESTKL